MKWVHQQFGEMEFEEDLVVTFPEGIIGFEQLHKYIIVHDVDSEPFRWLVSIEDAGLAFPMLDPCLLLPAYSEAAVGSGKEIWVIASLHGSIERSSVNLRSPIVIEKGTRNARQVILDDDSLPFQFPLVPSTAKQGRS